jgi:hypothetical protein
VYVLYLEKMRGEISLSLERIAKTRFAFASFIIIMDASVVYEYLTRVLQFKKYPSKGGGEKQRKWNNFLN